MILQALANLYQRKLDLGEIAPPGFEVKEIQFLVVLTSDGDLVSIEDLRDAKKRGRKFLVPKSEIRSGTKIVPNLLWDSPAYTLGIGDKNPTEKHEAFKAKILSCLSSVNDIGAKALISFLKAYQPSQIESLPNFKEMCESTGNVSFRLQEEQRLILEREPVKSALISLQERESVDQTESICLISGKKATLARTHPPIKKIINGQPSGTAIVSFNQDSFCSYGKQQGANAPISENAAFAYTTALNSLLDSESRQKLLIGDTVLTFWSQENNSQIEDAIASLFGLEPSEDPARRTELLRAIFTSVRTGKIPKPENDAFYVLGLAANSARAVVRYWHASTASELSKNIVEYLENLKLEHGDNTPEFPSITYLLDSLAPLEDRSRLPPHLLNSLMNSALTGGPVDTLVAQTALCRLKTDHRSWRKWQAARCSLLKLYLLSRAHLIKSERRLEMSLDPQNTNIGYRLGRLFAVLEKAQEIASPNLNAGIRDRYYGAACSTPITVFSRLLRLKNHHVAKLSTGQKLWLEKLIGEIMEDIEEFPTHLSLFEQANFAIGYYHQRQSFFHKATDKTGELQCQN